MSQSSFNVANSDGATFRAALNAALQALASLSSGPAAPSTSYPFQLWADTANNLLKMRDAGNTAWRTLWALGQADIGLVPPGAIMPYAGSTAPDGWLMCYGQVVSRTTYAALFAKIGETFGAGDGSNTFSVPDLRGRVVAGLDNMGGVAAGRLTSAGSGVDGTTLGDTGGAEAHTLIELEIPAHEHASEGNGFIVGTGSGPVLAGSAGAFWDQKTATAPAGGGQAHNNVQPTIALNYIIKT